MIVLINPYITSQERYGKDIGDIGGHQMPLGIYYLAAMLRAEGHQVDVIDAEVHLLSHEEVIQQLRSRTISLLGITATTIAFRNARTLAEMLRASFPTVPIVIGGPQMTAMPEETMAIGAFDYGIVQEGEIALSKLVRYLFSHEGTLQAIPNLYFLHEGRVCKNTERARIADLDTIAYPARDLLPDISVYKPPVGAFRQRPVVNIITSRGCPYQCIFCDNNTFGRNTRFHSAEYVANEITEVIRKYGAKEIAFVDDTFVLDKPRLHRIFEILYRQQLRFPWTCMTRVNNVDYETLRFMRDHGCWQIRFGIESGNPEVLQFIKKGITLDQVRNVTQWCRQLGILTLGFFMIGHHIDTEDTIKDTINFALSIPLTDVVATINTPIPGTESYDLARQYGTYNEEEWTSANYWTPVFVPHGLTHQFLLDKQAELYRRFYMRPQILLNQTKKIKSISSLRMIIRNAILGLRFVKDRRE